jgi:ABC-type nitrate/sulfonate/bicarbonate transport system permease component
VSDEELIDPIVQQVRQKRRGRRTEGKRGVGGWLVLGLRKVLTAAASIAVILLVWILFLKIFHVNSFIGKTPMDVWRYVWSTDQGPEARHTLLQTSNTTLRDAFIGLAAGTIAAVVFAILFNLSRTIEQTFMPVAMVLRSVPLVAMTPLIALVFGRGLMCVTVIAGIVTFFPTLVNVSLALRSTPRASVDLFRAYGSNRWTMLYKAQLPSALPALFASLRIAAPLALVGAVLVEFLVTGAGLGYLIQTSMTQSVYNMLWAAVALVTLFSIVLYTIIAAAERRVLGRFADFPA